MTRERFTTYHDGKWLLVEVVGEYRTLTCPYCGERFQTTDPRKMFCSHQHAQNTQQQRYRDRLRAES